MFSTSDVALHNRIVVAGTDVVHVVEAGGYDALDFEVFSRQDWSRVQESHGPYIRVHWPDGHYTDGIDMHTQDMAALFAWAPDLRIETHPLRVAKNNLTAVTGVMKGTFTQPTPDGKGGTIASAGQAFGPGHDHRRDLEPPGHDE
jgi:SnoaL-like protein